MSKVFLITYDLRKPGQNYSELYDEIKKFNDFQHPLESTWFIRVGNSLEPNDVYKMLRPKIDDQDYLFVVDITDQERQGWLARSFWNWLRK